MENKTSVQQNIIPGMISIAFKEGDDLMSATRYALMSLRHASTKAAYDSFRRPIQYADRGWM